MTARILLTRSEQDSKHIASLLSEHQIAASIEPLLRIETLPITPPTFSPDVIIATSRHALSAVVALKAPLIVTGEGSAKKAQSLGFERITTLDSARAAFDHLIAYYPTSAKVLYLSGRDITVDIAGALRDLGYDATRIITYIAHAATELSQSTQTQIRSRALDGVMFFSARTCAIYESLVTQAGLVDAHKNMEAFCLSAEIAKAAKHLPFKQIHIAEKTDTQTLVNAVLSRYPTAG